jgi:hypothetical protein
MAQSSSDMLGAYVAAADDAWHPHEYECIAMLEAGEMVKVYIVREDKRPVFIKGNLAPKSLSNIVLSHSAIEWNRGIPQSRNRRTMSNRDNGREHLSARDHALPSHLVAMYMIARNNMNANYVE